MYDFHKSPENKQEYEAWLNKCSEQYTQSLQGDVIRCVCGKDFLIQDLYRCFYCGLWFCSLCAIKHFGERPKGIYTWRNYLLEMEASNNEQSFIEKR